MWNLPTKVGTFCVKKDLLNPNPNVEPFKAKYKLFQEKIRNGVE